MLGTILIDLTKLQGVFIKC